MSLNGSSGQSSSNRDSCSQQNSSSQNLPEPEPFNKILIQADQLISQQKYSQAVTKLNLLTEKINVIFLKQNKKQYDKKLQLVCLYNLASAYHKQWNLDQCIPLVDKFIIMLKSTIQQEQAKGKSYYWYKMKHLLIKTQLQYCAILSQVGDHYKALKIAIQVSQSLKEFFNKGYNQVVRYLNKIHKIDSKKSLASSWGSEMDLNSKNLNINNDKVQFATNLLNEAKQSLIQLTKIQTHQEVVKGNFQKICQQLIQLKSRTYFWKDNPQNNIKLLRKQLNQQKQQLIQSNIMNSNKNQQSDSKQRNLLGIKKSKSWIEQITIAKIMVMSPINYLQFAEKDNVIFQFNYKNLVQKIILVSVTYFSLAIELRFIQTTQKNQKLKKQQMNLSLSVNEKNTLHNTKEQKQQEKQMKKSEVFHLKSIILLCKMVKQNSAFLNHLVMNYHKHYKQDLITIQQQSSMAQYSHIYDKRSKSNSTYLKTYENQIILPDDDDQNQEKQAEIQYPSPSKKFPVQSAYFQDNDDQKIIKKKSPNTKKNPLIDFKKVNSTKKDFDISQDKSKKYLSSTSMSRNQTNPLRQSKSAKYITHKDSLKDRTVKKISVGKIISLGSPIKFGCQTQRSKQKSVQRETSLSRFNSMRSFQKKSFSTRSIPSFSLGKINMNSTTLKHKKRRGQKSPQKQKFKLKDLKQSNQFKKADFKKKQKQIDAQQKAIKFIKDKKKQKLNNGLTLLKQSSSNPNLRSPTNKISQQYNLDQDFASIKQKSKKVQKYYTRK